MRQWEIYTFPHPDSTNPHPCVVVSADNVADNPSAPHVNVLPCTSLRPADRMKVFEVRLNGEDGLSGPTLVKCNLILAFKKDQVIGSRLGIVGRERQRAIKETLARSFGIFGT